MSHAGCKIDHSEFLQALAEREELVRNGRMTTIIFIRDNKNCKNEISGYIDLAHRLKTEDFRLYFEGKKMLLPKPSDLSYYNWETHNCTLFDSPSFIFYSQVFRILTSLNGVDMFYEMLSKKFDC